MDENDLLEALNEGPVTPPAPKQEYKSYNNYGGGNKPKRENLWNKTDFKEHKINTNNFNKQGKSFYCYSFVPRDKTPPDEVVLDFNKIGKHLASKGFLLRYSGDDKDLAQSGLLTIENLDKETYLGFPNCNANIQNPTLKFPEELGYAVAKTYHNSFPKLHPAVRAKLAATCHALFGKTINNPVDLVIVWNSTGDIEFNKSTDWKNVGDIHFINKLCKEAAIPVFNIGNEKSKASLLEYLKSI